MENDVQLAIDNAKRLLNKTNVPIDITEKWITLCNWFRESVLTYMKRRSGVDPVLSIQLEPWMIDLLPISDHLSKLVYDSFESKHHKVFTMLQIGHACFIQGHMEDILKILEEYKTNKKKDVKMQEDGSGGGGDDDRVLIREFITECIQVEAGIECGDYLIYFSWCTWIYEKFKSDNEEIKTLPGRRQFNDLFFEIGGFEVVQKRYKMVKGIKVRATKQTPWLPLG